MAKGQWRHHFQIETACEFSSLYNLKFNAFVIVLAKAILSGTSKHMADG